MDAISTRAHGTPGGGLMLEVRLTPFDGSGAFRPVGGALRRLAVRGAAATVSAQGLALAIQVIATVVLARLLTPADFGVVAMVTTFSLLLMSFGIKWLLRGCHSTRGNGPVSGQQSFLDHVRDWVDPDDRVCRVGVAARAFLPKSARRARRGGDIGGDLHCRSLHHTLGSPKASHAVRRRFRQRRCRPCGIYRCSRSCWL